MAEQDLAITCAFLEAFGGLEVDNTWQVYPEPKTDSNALPAILHGSWARLRSELVRANKARAGVSLCVNQTDGKGRSAENITRARALFLDFDRGAPSVWEPLPPSIVVTTPRGCHAYWLLREGDGTDLDRWERIQRALAIGFRAEVCTDRTKALRAPGFLHQKHAPQLLTLKHCNPDHRVWSSDVVDAFELAVVERKVVLPASLGSVAHERRVFRCQRYVDACGALTQGMGETHSRSNAMCGIGGDFGLDPDDYWPILCSWNDRGNPPIDERQLWKQLVRVHRIRRDPFGVMLEQDRDRTPSADLVREGVAPDAPWPEAPERTGGRKIYARQISHPGADELPPGEGLLVGRRTISREGEAPPADPWFEGLDRDAIPLPEDAPAEIVARDRSREQTPPGGDHDGADREQELPEPPADAGGELPPPPEPPGDRDGGGGRRSDKRILNRNAPLESAKQFCEFKFRWRGKRTLVHHQRCWFVWNGRSFREVSREDLNARLYDYLEPAFHENEEGNLVSFNPDETRVGKVRHALEAVSHLDDERRAPCWLSASSPKDKQPPVHELVSCRNGLLHLPTGEFLGQRPDFFALTSLGVDYKPDAKPPEAWIRFLADLWPEDEPAIELLQEWFGLSLVPDTSFQKLLFVVGPRRSGKGTIARVLSELHGGESNCAWLSMEDLVSRFGLHPLIDKQVAIMPDVRISHKLDQSSAVEKLLRITGEDSLSIDRKNMPVIHAQLGARFMLMSNLAPRLSDAGAAFVSRVLALRMEASFLGREDRQLKRKLIGELRGHKRVGGELEGILLWAIEGWRRLVARGYFVQPASAQDVVEDMAELSTPVVGFVRQCCCMDSPEDWAHTDVLWEAWKSWCETEGRASVGEKSTFVRNLRAAYPRITVRRNRAPTGRRVKVFYGIRLLTDDELDGREPELPWPTDKDSPRGSGRG